MRVPRWFDPRRATPYHWTHVFDVGAVTFAEVPSQLAPHACDRCGLCHSVELCPYPDDEIEETANVNDTTEEQELEIQETSAR